MPDIPQDNWFATTIMPMLLMFGGVMVIFMLMNRQNGAGANSKAMNFGKSRARLSTEQDKKITFAQVAGLREEKEDLEEIVDFLRSPKKYIQVGRESLKEFSLWDLREPERLCLQRQWPVRQEFRSLPSQDLTLWKCLSE